MVTVTGGRLPEPSAATPTSGTSISVAVLPPSSTVARNFMGRSMPSARSVRAGPDRGDDGRGEGARILQRREVTDAVEPGEFGGGEELADPVGPFAGEQRIVFGPQHRGGYRDPLVRPGYLLGQGGGDRPRARLVPGDRGGERARRGVDRHQVI